MVPTRRNSLNVFTLAQRDASSYAQASPGTGDSHIDPIAIFQDPKLLQSFIDLARAPFQSPVFSEKSRAISIDANVAIAVNIRAPFRLKQDINFDQDFMIHSVECFR